MPAQSTLVTCVCQFCGITFYRTAYDIQRSGGKTCSRTCAARLRQGQTPTLHCHGETLVAKARVEGSLADRFWARVEKSPGCWLWTGAKIKSGYGHFVDKKVLRYTHRYVYELTYGPPPEGLSVLHTCDNTSCCRPDHLFLGTDQDNADDKVRKGRSCYGVKNSHAKLTEPQVLEIRRTYRKGVKGYGQISLGKRFGVTSSSIRFIIIRKNWAYLPETKDTPSSS